MVRIDITNRALFVYGVLIVLFLGIGFGVAFGGNEPTVMGHSAGEIEGVCLSDGTNCAVNTLYLGLLLSDIEALQPGAVCGAPESFYISGCNRYCRDVRGFISGTAVEYGCGVSPATVACLCVR